jgi:hypothetical protein
MEDCLICYSNQKKWKILPCQHKMCFTCYLSLDVSRCPFCRKDFKYNQIELKQKNKLNIDYSNWQPPPQLILPNGFNEIIRVNNRNNQTNDNRIQIDEIDYSRNPEFSRLSMNRIRRRRRNLSIKEIQERRKRIKKKCKKKWNRKNARYRKMNWWNIPVN